MKVEIAKDCGFCYGVRRAVDMASKATAGTHTLGPIIHNPQVVQQLAQQGVTPIDNLRSVHAGETVLIRSHGVGPEVYEEAQEKKVQLVDATCPHVKKAQQDAKKIVSQEKKLVIIGEKNHPEVISISQWGVNRAIIILSLIHI